MLLWLILALLTAGVLAAVLRPLLRPVEAAGDGRAEGTAVYRDLLREIEADRERGRLSAEEAVAARAEVGRRLLAREQPTRPAVGAAAAEPSRHARLVLATLLLLPALALAIYLAAGRPGLPDLPYLARQATPMEERSLAELIGRVEARLKEHPEDGRGWEVLAPIYLKQERYAEAAAAYSNAIERLGESAARLEGLGEAQSLAAGRVDDKALAALRRARELEPERPRTRFWLAVAAEQGGRIEEAVALYRGLLEGAAPDAPWVPMVSERLAALTGAQGSSEPSGAEPAPGPSSEDVAAAAGLSAEERSAMIGQMVGRLAERLKQDGKDLAGWQRLIRAYVVLGRKAEALQALADGRKALSGDAAALAGLEDFARGLGLGT